MERWEKVSCGTIPKGHYECELVNGELTGLVLKLKSEKNIVKINFGAILCLRMFDEGVLLADWPPMHIQRQIREVNSVIYEITDGELLKEVQDLSKGIYVDEEIHHYAVLSENYLIEIISKWEPDISIIQN